MSEEKNDKNAAGTSACASCGSAEVDDIKLKECDDCDLVRYCSDTCQKEHEPTHEEACVKRAAELRDELLLRQPESNHLGDCPICMIPLPLDQKKSTMHSCCSKVICKGCNHANKIREKEGRIEQSCPFCRQPVPTLDEQEKYRRKRIEANDPVAMLLEGIMRHAKGDYIKEFEYYTKATELGDVEAHYKLACMYNYEHGVEKDMGKIICHLEEAIIGGHPAARYNLGCDEWNNNNNAERAVKHWIIAASQGDDLSIKLLLKKFRRGIVSKDDLAAALRAHKAAVDATKSPQREAAEEYHQTERSGVDT